MVRTKPSMGEASENGMKIDSFVFFNDNIDITEITSEHLIFYEFGIRHAMKSCKV